MRAQRMGGVPRPDDTPTPPSRAVAPPRGAHGRRWSIAPTMVANRRHDHAAPEGCPGPDRAKRPSLYSRTSCPPPWDKLIERSLLEGVYFPEIFAAPRMSASSDQHLRAQSVTVIDEPLYAYAVNAGSLT